MFPSHQGERALCVCVCAGADQEDNVVEPSTSFKVSLDLTDAGDQPVQVLGFALSGITRQAGLRPDLTVVVGAGTHVTEGSVCR